MTIGEANVWNPRSIYDPAIMIDTYQEIRDYAGDEITLYARGVTGLADGGEAFFQFIDGKAAGTYVDDNVDVLVPTGGNGSSGWVRNQSALPILPNNTSYIELTATVGVTDLGSINAGHLIYTNYFDSSRLGSSGTQLSYTGIDIPANAGNVPNTDGYFYDSTGRQFEINEEFIRITAMGGINDGATDNTSVITACMAAMVTSGKVLLLDRAGTYMTDKITPTAAAMTFRGISRNQSTLKLNNSQNTHLIDNSQNRFILEDLALDGNSANQTSNSYCLIQRAGFDSRVSNCKITNGFTHNFLYIANTFTTMENCIISNSGNNGGYVGAAGSGCTDHIFANCQFKNNLTHGLIIGTVSAVVRRILVTGCEFSGGGRHTNLAGGGGCWVVEGARYVTITGCQSYDNLGDGLSCHGGEGVSFSGCVSYLAGIADPTGTPEPNNGFVCSNGSANVTFSGCVSHTNSANGFTIGEDVTNASITGCIAYNNSQISTSIWSGIMFTDSVGSGAGANYVEITGNVCYDNQGSATQKYGVGITSTGNPPRNAQISDNTFYGNTAGGFDSANAQANSATVKVRASDNRGYNPIGAVTAPTYVSASTFTNTFPHPVWVHIAGSATAIQVGANVTGLTGSNSVLVDVGQTIKVTGASGWNWQGM